jgi:hypothetical protein
MDVYKECSLFLGAKCKIVKKYLCVPSADISGCYRQLFKIFGEAVLFKVNSLSGGVEIYQRFEEILLNLEKIKHSFNTILVQNVKEDTSKSSSPGLQKNAELDSSVSSSGGITNTSFNNFGFKDKEEKRMSFQVVMISKEG